MLKVGILFNGTLPLRYTRHLMRVLLQNCLFILLSLLFGSFRAFAEAGVDDTLLERAPTTLSTNWTGSAKAVLSSRYQTEDISFEQLTNLLSKESDQGNAAAQGLWGFALVIKSQSSAQTTAGLAWLQSSAGKDYVPAMRNLGFLYETGRFLEKDYSEAVRWFRLAADKGDAESELQLGGCYHSGLGVDQDYSMAAKWYRRSADQTNYVAMKSLGYLLLSGLGVDKDLEAARYWSARAANEGNNRRAMLNMGAICLLESSYTNISALTEAFHWYKQSANLGDPLACLQVANFYYNGWGVVATNLDSYYSWLSRAANLGATEAQYFLAQAYRTGNGMPKDIETSLLWYDKAAAKNDPRALYDLGVHYSEDRTNQASLNMAQQYFLLAARGGHRAAQLLYALSCFRGDVAPLDCGSGKQWLAKAAENNWGRAEFLLFQLCLNGISVTPQCAPYPKDPVEAVRWIRRAAEHEDFQAQSVLAVMLIRGNGVEQDKKEAERLLRNAATHGYAAAQNDLGFAILNGDTSKSDLVEAASWCKLAESTATDPKTLQNAKVNFANASAKLIANEQSEVDRRVRSFHPIPTAALNPLSKDWEKNPNYQQEDGRFGH